MKIINLTQHQPTPDQMKAGVYQPEKDLSFYLNFEKIPSKKFLTATAELIASVAEEEGAEAAMIGGAPFLMSRLEISLYNRGIKCLYAFSKRESVEETAEDGSVLKKNIFSHIGFVEA